MCRLAMLRFFAGASGGSAAAVLAPGASLFSAPDTREKKLGQLFEDAHAAEKAAAEDSKQHCNSNKQMIALKSTTGT